LKKLLLRGENFVKLYILLAAFGVAASQAVPQGIFSATFIPLWCIWARDRDDMAVSLND